MNWKFSDMICAHKSSSNNKTHLKSDNICGCFYCRKIFSPDEIKEYIYADNEANGTAVCPYCGVDSVIGESSGYPITDDFLASMSRFWMETESAYAILTPFGEVRIQLDGVDQCFDYYRFDDPNLPDLNGIYSIPYHYFSDGKEHALHFYLADSPVKGDPETGERLEANSFYIGKGKITLGCHADFFDCYNRHRDFDFDGWLPNDGVEITILPTTKSQTFKFAVCWLVNCTEENDVQTWYGADPNF